MKRVAVGLMIALFLNISLASANCVERRIQFARGQSSAVLTGRVSANKGVCYKLRVREGQRMTVRLTSPGRRARLLVTPDDYDAEPLALEVTEWEGELQSANESADTLVAPSESRAS